MATATTIAPEAKPDTAPDNDRRCIATGEVRPKDELIRFVLSPDGDIVPDLAHNLPGRGLWVSATREAIDTAQSKNLFSRAAKTPARALPGLADRVAELLKKRCLDFLGLAKSAGIAILGQPQVETALKARKLALLLLAQDAAPGGLEKLNTGDTPTFRGFDRGEIGLALGHDHIVYAGLQRHKLTKKLQNALMHLEKIAATRHLS